MLIFVSFKIFFEEVKKKKKKNMCLAFHQFFFLVGDTKKTNFDYKFSKHSKKNNL